jgi:hypothetical protein
MKTIISTTALAAVALTFAAPSADASDLSQMFRALQATQQTSVPAVAPTAPRPAPAAPQLLLGAWLSDSEGRLQVASTVPGSPASQTLQPGDVLCRISVAGGPTRTVRTLNQFEYAKRQIGPNRQSVLEIYRPGVGMVPMNVTFETAGGLANVALSSPQPNNSSAAAEGEGLVSR